MLKILFFMVIFFRQFIYINPRILWFSTPGLCMSSKKITAPRAWYQCFADFVRTMGFTHSVSDNSIFFYRQGNDMVYLLLYVDDIILTTSFEQLRKNIMASVSSEFAMKDLGPLNYFFGYFCYSSFFWFISFSKEICIRNYWSCTYVCMQTFFYTNWC